MLLSACFNRLEINRHSLFPDDINRQVNWKAIGLQHRKSLFSRKLRTGGLANFLLQEVKATAQAASEFLLLFRNNLKNMWEFIFKLRVLFLIIIREHFYCIQEVIIRYFQNICRISHAANKATYNILCAFIARFGRLLLIPNNCDTCPRMIKSHFLCT